MADLSTAQTGTLEAHAALATARAASQAGIAALKGQLATALASDAGIAAQQIAVAGMIEAGKIVSAVEGAIPGLEAEAKAIVANPWGKRIVIGLGVLLAVVVAVAAWHYLPH